MELKVEPFIKNGEPWKRTILPGGGIVEEINIPIPEQEYVPPVDPNQELRDIVAAQSAQIELLLKALNK